MENRYSWKQMPENYNASYFNYKDLNEGRKFIIIDKLWNREITFPNYEERKDDRGFYHKVNIIDYSMWNQEFFNWICSTSPDFCINIPKEFLTDELIDICLENTSNVYFIKEVPNLTQDQCTRFIRHIPEGIKTIPKCYINAEIIDIVINHNPKLIRHIPRDLISNELLLSTFNKLSADTKCDFISCGYMNGVITSDMLKDLLKDKERTKQIEWSKIPKKIIDEEIASMIDDRHICFIPEEFITHERCKNAVLLDCVLIQYVPLKFQTPELHKLVLDADVRKIPSIPEESLTDEIIFYALNKNALALGGVPESKRTKELCEFAIEKDPRAFRSVPNKYKTYEMARKCVIFDPRLIRNVPVNILTKEFYDELITLDVIIPSKHIKYVKECIHTNELINNSSNTQKEELSPKETKPVSKDLYAIPIEGLSTYFSSPAIKAITRIGIHSLGELFQQSETPEFISIFERKGPFNEIMGTIKILKCKYLNIDPLIDLNDDTLTIKDACISLGLSTRTYNAIKRRSTLIDKTQKDFFEIMQNSDIDKTLRQIRCMGDDSIEEFKVKFKIVVDYYQNKSNQKEESLEELNAELKRLTEERKKLEEQTEIIIKKIQEKTQQLKGGTLS